MPLWPDCDQLQERFRAPMQRRYAIIRPLVRLHDRTAIQRAEATHTHPATVGTLTRRFEHQGMLGLVPAVVERIPAGRQPRVPEAVVQEFARLKGLYSGFQYHERCRIIFATPGYRVSDTTIKKLWQTLPLASPPHLPRLDSHRHPERSQARWHVMQLSDQGWSKRSMSRCLHVSRPTLTEWMRRFERDNLASLEDKSRAPKAPARKAGLPVMLAIDHLQKRHPDAGGFRIWSLLGTTDLSGRTGERILAVNRQVYEDIPHGAKPRPPQTASGLHPCKAALAHEYWCIDGRIMDCA